MARGGGGPHESDAAGAPVPVGEGTADHVLVARMRVRDEAAFREFFLRFRALIVMLAARARVPAELREEVADDFLEGMALSLASARAAPRQLSAYVATSFQNHLANEARLRKQRLGAARAAAVEATSGESVVPALASEASLRAAGALHDHHDDGPPPALGALLVFLEGEMTDDEHRLMAWVGERVPQRLIAQWLGVTHLAARLRIFRLRARLRAKILAYADRLPPGERAEVLRVLGRAGEVTATSGRGGASATEGP